MENYHLVHKDEQWKLEKQGSERSIRNFETKSDAMNFSVDYMNNHGGSLKIHTQDGRFQEERTYPKSADPRKSKG
jgi:hypothetical protein